MYEIVGPPLRPLPQTIISPILEYQRENKAVKTQNLMFVARIFCRNSFTFIKAHTLVHILDMPGIFPLLLSTKSQA